MMQKRITIVIPLAGKGKRFREAGFTSPKPLIPVLGKPMVWWALQTFAPLICDPNVFVVFVIQDELEKHADLLKNLGPSGRTEVVTLNSPTRGQAESVLLASSVVHPDSALYIFNCDTYSRLSFMQIDTRKPDGAIFYFKGSDPRYSYIRTYQDQVVEVAEKHVISDKASNGLYYFKSADDFFSAASDLIRQNRRTQREFYVMPCYDILLKSGKQIAALQVTENWIMGTPDELSCFLRDYKE